MTRVKRLRLLTGSYHGIASTECRYGVFTLETDRRTWHVQLSHQGDGIPRCSFNPKCVADADHDPVNCLGTRSETR